MKRACASFKCPLDTLSDNLSRALSKRLVSSSVSSNSSSRMPTDCDCKCKPSRPKTRLLRNAKHNVWRRLWNNQQPAAAATAATATAANGVWCTRRSHWIRYALPVCHAVTIQDLVKRARQDSVQRPPQPQALAHPLHPRDSVPHKRQQGLEWAYPRNPRVLAPPRRLVHPRPLPRALAHSDNLLPPPPLPRDSVQPVEVRLRMHSLM